MSSGPFLKVAPISYAIYVLHFPIGIAGPFSQLFSSKVIGALAGVIAVFAVAWFAEKPLQHWINKFLGKLIGNRISSPLRPAPQSA